MAPRPDADPTDAAAGADPESAPDSDLDALATDYGSLAAELDARGAVGFVAVGDRFDDDLRYLTRFSGPDRAYAFVFAAGEATLCAPALFDDQARREFPGGTVRTADQGAPAGVRAAAALDARGVDGGTLLVPQGIPHDAAVRLENAGFDLESTAAVREARRVKADAELDRLRRVQRAALRGVARAEAILAAGEADGDRVTWNGGPLSTERLRRQVNGVLAAHGVRDAGNTVVGCGPTAADLHFTGLDAVRPGETVLLDVSPRGPDGYYGDVTRTFAVDSGGGWERRAYVAVEAAREAALDELAAGVPASTVHEEAAAELAAHGFRVDGADRGFVHSTGHGVGVSLHEAPSLSTSGSDELEAGNVVTVEPGVYDPETGGVRLEDLAVVTDDGYELLGEYPRSLVPHDRG
ncbi:M24 family metallopeptidase [Candidatus Halobonum tyrrellensis]|uniref:Xaa-pro aminopeptidase n=1 Tax=Candidatus Halobonum tyrrellensis G22 TaxID=1324957 RepID=V4HAF0_9EURY|nr:Xaa-Pro peptidase family protein [Candidatus Halobonum tyrrellensis]ESP87685.1 xaa-pro aminopeptidase [Candidatus Halobonum tyrrellensis G22]